MAGDPIADALAALGKDDLLLGIPDRSFPGDADDDTGAGAPDSRAGRRFLAWVKAIGFTGVQLAPQGETSAGNASPYDGTVFSRGRLSLAVARLAEPERGLLSRAAVEALVAGCPDGDPERVRYRYALAAHGVALVAAHAAFVARSAARDPGMASLAAGLAAFRARAAGWLEHDALYEALRVVHGGAEWPEWPTGDDRDAFAGPEGDADAPTPPGADPLAAARATHAGAIARYAFAQYVLHEQHRAVRQYARDLGLALWGDLQVGLAHRDVWARRRLFLDGYLLGAPPSRTTPEGQPWGYPVLDPGDPGSREGFVTARLEKMFQEYDGVRVDHPHGLVCPWVYRAGTGNDGAAVRRGARLFESPDLPDHPALGAFAIARRAQLNPTAVRWADDWVASLDPAQVERYACLVDAAVAAARRHGRGPRALACEVLSTCPLPLGRVLARHGLGRFRVTQKADLHDPQDVYRSENAAPADWVMIGTHDTPPIWELATTWERNGTLGEHAAYLAWRLAPAAEREGLERRLAASPALLVQAQLADLLASPARHVMVFFSDAFGLRERYNEPGAITDRNWTLRLAPDHRERYRRLLAHDGALNLPLALALALRARGDGGDDRRTLLARLDAEAERWRRGDLPG